MKQTILAFTFTFILGLNANSFAQWIQVADFVGTERDDLVAFTCAQRAFAGSGMEVGFQVTKDFYEYDNATNQWLAIADLPGIARQYAFSFSFADYACVYAGTNQQGNDLKDGYQYTPQNNTWNAIAPFPGNGSRACASANIGNMGYAGLGRNNGSILHNDWWQYNLDNNTWIQKSSFPGLGRNLAACFESNGYIYVVGGIGVNDVALGDTWKYNPQNDNWIELPSLFINPIGSAAVCKVKYSGVMVAGFDGQSNYYDHAITFDGYNAAWSNLPPISIDGARKGSKAFSINDELYVTCGIKADNTRLKSTWKYNQINSIVQDNAATLGFRIYPIAVSDSFDMLIEEQNIHVATNYSINTITGIEVLKGIIQPHQRSFKLYTTGLSDGMYLLKMFNENKVFIQKLIITR